jgi:hypothetical protein
MNGYFVFSYAPPPLRAVDEHSPLGHHSHVARQTGPRQQTHFLFQVFVCLLCFATRREVAMNI